MFEYQSCYIHILQVLFCVISPRYDGHLRIHLLLFNTTYNNDNHGKPPPGYLRPGPAGK